MDGLALDLELRPLLLRPTTEFWVYEGLEYADVVMHDKHILYFALPLVADSVELCLDGCLVLLGRVHHSPVEECGENSEDGVDILVGVSDRKPDS